MRKLLTMLSLTTWALASHAETELMINDPYVRATPPNITTSAVFAHLHNHADSPVTIVSATTPAAGSVELHTVETEGDVMKMRQVDQLVVPANQHLLLKPGGLHIMLFDLSQPLVEGESINLELTFADGRHQSFIAPIKKVLPAMKHHH
ncbi:copper chaperone PCu(A)C [Vibrio sp. WXL103]|uniref:copper chaperone PCu(A)C n=1 Tax=unclassified Vibrio TaxID=2614977 RepID=UPI003EC63DC5